ncbi:hypothetical protein F8M41_005337 [Gigaspora margarita]|uniref:Uncharacterized protein n=1 Tax=Gigaspora margarita TaxID=4874 RepID=A0A8H4A5Z9_GIGMA|nr:hypothetical protein F8M41_005337 [Gigaspora margarita]
METMELLLQIEKQKEEIIELKKTINEYCEEIIRLRELYQKKCEENDELIEQWNSRHNDQYKRIEEVINIAQRERECLYEEIESLIRDNNRFSLENPLNYDPQTLLSNRNQVVTKFIETLTHNNFNTNSIEKNFKRAMVVDLIYGSRHGKYVSEINLMASAIKYSIARSKTIINIDNHITCSGSYTRFQSWLNGLSEEEEPLPDGLLFIAFDNEQKGQRNYLDRGVNTVIFHIVTSFVAFNMEPRNHIQYTNTPWTFNILNRLQYENLFEITLVMQEAINQELYTYLNEILELLCEEKLSAANEIDSFIANTGSSSHCDKRCTSCGEQNIENRKQVCPNCRVRLPALSELPKQDISGLDKGDREQAIIFKPYLVEKKTNSPTVPRIILSHIEKISGIKDGRRKWVAITCDGVPYHRIIKVKEKYPWLVLIPEQLHEEMNMLRAYVELNW